jgi:hypothetical protein
MLMTSFAQAKTASVPPQRKRPKLDAPRPQHNAYRTVAYRTVRYRTVQYQTVPYRTVPYGTVPYGTVPYRTVPYRTAPHGYQKDGGGEIKTSATKSKIIQASLHEALLAFVATLVAH